VFGRQPQQIGQRIVEVVASGNCGRCGCKELCIGAGMKWSFAGHVILPVRGTVVPVGIVEPGSFGGDWWLSTTWRFDARRFGSAAYTPAVKLVIAVVHNEDARVLIDALLAHEYRATWLHSSGGFLKQSNATILVGVDDAKVDDVVALVRDNCRARTQTVSPIPPIMEPGEFFMPYPLEVEVGGAVVFVLPIDRLERI
jgi:uncharacterized protein YaaQ